ncbi:hypothetical protein VB10N_40740 [Vibrio sp. 10N]|nr:hypothetical protein VB10N_40740 [Vibrio sp. 10N]
MALVRGLLAGELFDFVLTLFVIHKAPFGQFVHGAMASATDPTFIFTGSAAGSDDNDFLGHEEQSRFDLVKNKAPIIH